MHPGSELNPAGSMRRRLLTAAIGSLLAVYLLAAMLVLFLQYAVLPNIETYAPQLEELISRQIGKKVSIGHIEARWQGMRAELDLNDLRVYDGEGRMALRLPAVEAVIAWRSFAFGSLSLYSLVLDRPDLQIRRDAFGRIFVAGLPVDGDSSGPASLDWVLSQREIVVRDARLAWDDEARAAPTLALTGVNLVIRNSPFAHKFALRADPAPNLASRVDIRGEFRGPPPPGLLSWPGRLYAEFDYTDLAAWQRWVDYPVVVDSGRGGLRVWLTLGRQGITDVTADVALAELRAKGVEDSSNLELKHLQGRISGRDAAGTLSLAGRRVDFSAPGGAAVASCDFDLRWKRPHAKIPGEGEFAVNVLDLEPAVRVARTLPLPAELRARFAGVDPRGEMRDLKVSWTGDWSNLQRYAVRGRFSGLQLAKLGAWGGFAGASGSIDATQSGGNLRLEPSRLALDLPGILPETHVEFDAASARIAWVSGRNGTEIRIDDSSFSNREIAGSVQGRYTARGAKSSDLVDLVGHVTRAEAKTAFRYIPLLPDEVRDYLKESITAGQVADGRLLLKGDLAHFPFSGGKSGVFLLTARLADAVFEFAQAWPKITGISGELRFEAERMRILAPRATMLGARLSNIRAQIPDLYRGDERLRVDGTAEGPTAEFLRFVDASPVAEQIGGATHEMAAVGNGRLQLGLDIPLRRPEQVKVVGQFQFVDNQFIFDPAFPPLTQLNGRFDFTESTLSGRGLSAQFLGGNTTFSLATRNDGAVTINAQGTAAVSALQRVFDSPWLRRASGNTAWTAAVTLDQGRFELQIDAPLAGVAIALPEPLGKPAADALPLRILRSNRTDTDFVRRARVARLPDNGDAVAVFLGAGGRLASGIFIRRRSADGLAVQRGALGINEPMPTIDDGITVSASFSEFDLDRWRGLVADDAPGGSAATGVAVSSLKLNAGGLRAGGRRFTNVRLAASPSGPDWNATISARELEGTLQWQPQGQGRIAARLKRFALSDTGSHAQVPDAPAGDLPALDITADEFVLGDKPLGRLELGAVNQARDWRIERLLIANADGALSASGKWQSGGANPQVSLDFKLQLSDAGKFLTRLGYPDTLKTGSATMEGSVSWRGSPQSIDYPTLGGAIHLTAGKGEFLRAEPGIAKLLGILSLQSWITLDFREFFGEGFAFENISSSAQIQEGILTANDFSMRGKAADVSMAGTLDLDRETQNLRVRVVPAVGGFASLLAIVANPVWGLGSLVLQRVLKDPLGQIFAFEYSVTGTWSEPKTQPLRAEPIQNSSPAP